jgi:hypothetical protein
MSKLIFPEEILDQHLVVLGKTGAGKSSALRHIVEHLLAKKKRVCIIDPKGDWWGLKASADGKGAGFPVIAFGDFKNDTASDVPINAQSGRHVAELITSGNRPCIIGFRGWMTSHMVQFWIDFASGIFNANSGELYLVGDEFHNFAPKGKIMDPQAGKCLHWSNRLMSEGRGLGIVCLIASQRPQKVHNDTLTSCETLVAMRVVHAADRGAVEDWIEGAGDVKQGKIVLYGNKEEKIPGLAQMSRGNAWVWSPEAGYGPVIVAFPMFKTSFDSFAPPQLQKKVSRKDWSDVDLDQVKAKLESVIKEHQANDPRELRKQLSEVRGQMSELQRKLEKSNTPIKSAAAGKPDPKQTIRATEVAKAQRALEAAMKFIVEITTKNFDPSLPEAEVRKAIDGAVDQALKRVNAIAESRQRDFDKFKTDAGRLLKQMKTIMESDVAVKLEVRHNEPFSVAPFGRMPTGDKILARERSPLLTGQPAAGGDVRLGTGERRCAIAIAQHRPNGCAREQLTTLTGFKRSTRNTYLQRLLAGGLVTQSGERFVITQEGLDWIGSDYEPLPTGTALQNYWLQKLPAGESRVLGCVLANSATGLTREQIGEATGFKRSTRNTYIQRLAARELVTVSGETVQPRDSLFD